jgi:hypothetical protein
VTLPSFLNTAFAYTPLSNVSDMATVITAVDTMLTSTLPVTPTAVFPSGQRWTNLGSGVYKSPVDSAGRFMLVTLVRVSAIRLQFRIDDPTGLLQDGRMDLSNVNSPVFIYGGPGHLIIEEFNSQSGVWEICAAIISDPTPEPLLASPVYVWCRTSRDAGGGLQGNNGSCDWWMGRNSGGSNTTGSGFVKLLTRPHMPAQDTTATHLQTQAGSNVAAPAAIEIPITTNANNQRNVGKLYQCCLVDGNQVAGGDLPIPIDTGVIGTFRVLHLGPAGCVQFAVQKG